MLTVRNVSNDPFYNQAFEEYVYETFRDDDVFLLWKNTPPVVVGSYQNICREAHVEALRQRDSLSRFGQCELHVHRPRQRHCGLRRCAFPGDRGAECHRCPSPEKPDL